MSPVNRSSAPPLRDIGAIKLPDIQRLHLSNGVEVFNINAGNEEVVKVELIFDGGRWQEPKRAVASSTSKMLLEGTHTKNAQEIAEEIDFYGATISTEATIDYGLITLFTLNKHADHLFPILREVIFEAAFPERELTTYIQNSKQRLLVNMQKVDFLAHKTFNEALYGKEYPIGYTTDPEDYDSMSPSVLLPFYNAQYKFRKYRIIIAGKMTDHILSLLDEYFGKNRFPENLDGQNFYHEILSSPDKKIFVKKKDAVQSGIRLGKPIINKLHPDYPVLKVLNTILGGYFGSRLMQNLREDKGYCYGIHSSVSSYLHDAHLSIATEVGADITWDATKEIYAELDRLRADPVPEEELQLVKNYLLGVFLSDVDGPFNAAEVLRGLIVYGLDEQFFYRLIDITKSVTPSAILEMANKYLDPETMTEVIVGTPDLESLGEKTVISGIESDKN